MLSGCSAADVLATAAAFAAFAAVAAFTAFTLPCGLGLLVVPFGCGAFNVSPALEASTPFLDAPRVVCATYHVYATVP